MRTIIAYILLLTTAFATPAVSLSTDLVSAYTFRGARLAGPSIQPTLNAQVGPTYTTLWSNQSLNGGANEVDLTLGGGAAGFDGGLTAYTYPGLSRATYEPFVGYAHDLIGGIKVSLYAFRDLTLHTTSFEGKASFQLITRKRLTSTADVAVGSTRGGETPAYLYWSAGPTLRYQLSQKWAASVAAVYTSSDAEGGERDIWSGRLGISLAF